MAALFILSASTRVAFICKALELTHADIPMSKRDINPVFMNLTLQVERQ